MGADDGTGAHVAGPVSRRVRELGAPVTTPTRAPAGTLAARNTERPGRHNEVEMAAGRPRLLTDDLVERIVELRRDGYGVETIAAQLGVSKRTTQRALARARDSFAGAGNASAEAPAVYESALVESIARAGRVGWRAAAWLLERLAPERWDRTYRPPLPALTPSAAFAEVDELSRRRREQRE